MTIHNNDNYPPMMRSEYENAPWNEKAVLGVATVYCSYSKSVPIMSDVNFKERYYTIPELLEELRTMCEEKLKNADLNNSERKHYQRIADNCKGWIEDEFCDDFEEEQNDLV